MHERKGIEEGVEPDVAQPGEGAYAEDEFGRRSPLRRCVATGAVREKDGMVRFVVGPDALLVPDLDGTLPGRGVWVTSSREAVDRAAAKGLFARAARQQVRTPPDLADRVEAGLRRRCLDLLGLARKAGQAVAGHDKVRGWLEGAEAAVLVQAADGAPDGRARMRALAGERPSVELFGSAELAAALGREHVVHAALKPGGLARRFLAEAERLAGFSEAGTLTGMNERRGHPAPRARSEAVGRR